MRTIPPAQAEHQLTQVANRFEELKKRCAAHHAAQPAPASTALSFVEVTATPVRPTPPAGTEIELQRPDGTRLRIHTYEPQFPVATLVRTLLETPGCSS